jgi:hypothetical protein
VPHPAPQGNAPDKEVGTSARGWARSRAPPGSAANDRSCSWRSTSRLDGIRRQSKPPIVKDRYRGTDSPETQKATLAVVARRPRTHAEGVGRSRSPARCHSNESLGR